jgi:hypothetical protein
VTKKVFILMAAVGAAVALLVPSPVMSASDTPCVGLLTGTFDNVVVPPGATCFLTNSTVAGNVKALENSRLFITSSTVFGNVNGDKADTVRVSDSTVRQDISIKEGGPGPGFSGTIICRTTVQEGNIQVERMVGEVVIGHPTICGAPLNSVLKGNIKVQDNVITAGGGFFGLRVGNNVAQNLQVVRNTDAGLKTVSGNTAGESIQCFENTPPFVGGPNTAPNKEGQCF